MSIVQNPDLQSFLDREKKRQKENTYGNRRSGLLAFDQWLRENDISPDEVGFRDIEDFTDWLTTEKGNGGVSDRTAELYTQQVNQYYRYEEKARLEKESPDGRIRESEIVTPVSNAKLNLNRTETEREKHDHGKRKGLDPEEMELIIKQADSFKHQLVLKCLAGLGCRPSDLQDLRIKDIDLDDNRVKIRSTKTTNSREIPISNSLKEYLNLWLNHGYRSGCYYADSTEWLIPGERSEQIGIKTIRGIVHKHAGSASLQEEIYESSDGRTHYKINPYSFRVGYLTHMKDKVSPKELQYLAGHKKIETTLTYYTEVTDDDIDRMQGLVPDI